MLPKISKHAATLSMAQQVELNMSEPDRTMTSEIYAAIREALPNPKAHMTVTHEQAAIERGSVEVTYDTGWSITATYCVKEIK